MLRRMVAEFLGTFVIVFAPVALSGATKLNGSDSTLAAAAWVSGLSVLAMIYTLGHISSAHFNPAVTLAFVAAKRFAAKDSLPYIVAQLLGGVAAAGIAALVFGAGHGAHVPKVEPLVAVGLEVVISFILMFVIMGAAADSRAPSGFGGIAIGLTVVMNVWIAGSATGGSMNPARSFGPALFAQGDALQMVWVYLIAPIIGTLLAVAIYNGIQGKDSANG